MSISRRSSGGRCQVGAAKRLAGSDADVLHDGPANARPPGGEGVGEDAGARQLLIGAGSERRSAWLNY